MKHNYKGFITLLFIIFLFVFGCEKKNPVQVITDNSVLQLEGEKYPLPNSEEYLFRQVAKVSLNEDEDCVFAWRITTTDSLLPSGIFTNDEGWIWHYAAGADTSVSLADPHCKRTIWTSEKQQSWQFISSGQKLSHIISRVEVKVRRDGKPEMIYGINYRDDRIIGTEINVNFQNGSIVSRFIHVSLRERITDIYVDGMYAHHFMYRFNILDSGMNVIQEGNWLSSLEQEDIRELYINGMPVNEEGQYTQLEVYVVTRQGIEEATHPTIYFRVKGNLHPKTLIYEQIITGVGEYHYTHNPQYMSNYIYDNGHFSSYLFKDEDNCYTAINSSDFKLRLAFGWRGEYGNLSSSGNIVISDNPLDFVMNYTMDENTDTRYDAKVTHIDLQLDGAPFPLLLQYGESHIVTHEDNTRWRRYQINEDGSALIITLANLPNGLHSVKACAFDKQGVYDDTPAEFSFKLVQYIPYANRSGILIVDDDNNYQFCPEATVDSIYQNMLPTSYGNIVQWDMNSHQNNDYLNRKLAPSILQRYKVVVYHSDNPTYQGNLANELDGLSIYIENGGKFILSGCSNIKSIIQQSPGSGYSSNFFGAELLNNCQALTSYITPYFIKAVSANPAWQDVPVNTVTSYNSFVNLCHGFYSVTYFNSGTGWEALFKFGCKEPGSDNYSPTQDTYDNLRTKDVALKKNISGGGSMVIFGFPLSLMEQEQLRQALSVIINNMIAVNG